MVSCNITQLQAVTDSGQLISCANNATEGILLGFFTIALFVIIFLALKRTSDFAESFITTSFVCFILAGIFAYAGWINILYPLAYLVMTALSGLYIYSTRS